ncbi:peptidase S28, partial [Martensiomyces pterosporus]
VHYFQQKVDHFGLNDTTFKQRIYINGDSYAADGPVYLFNSGETPASPSYLIAGEPYNLAKATNGMVIIMEHRYYGDSYPVDDLSGPNMKYLTVENALEDIAYFIRNSATFVQSAIGVTITPQSKWVATGGSYSANLAVWARLEYPDLIHAAYASSAPVLAEIDFYQYDQVVGRALPCAQSIADAVLALDTILDSQDRGLIDSWKKTFGLELLKDDADFAGALTDQLSITVQYYMPPVAGSNSSDSIATLCSWFSRTQHTPLQNLADMTSAYIRNNNIDTVAAYSSYAGAKNTGLHQDGRAWFYQTCTQFGYWQTAPQPPLRRLRSKYMTVEWQSSPCSAFFGDSITGHANVGSINRKYGGLLPNVTRVVFVNGLMDPWSELSVGVD